MGKYGENTQRHPIQKNTEKHNHFSKLRQNLISVIANYDDQIGDMFLAEQQIPADVLHAAIRRIVIQPKTFGKVVPVLLGAAFRNLGVQPLLDAAVAYLPSPNERPPVPSINDETVVRKPSRKEPLSAFVFKVLFDPEQGPLAFTRVYSGRMGRVDVYNSTKKASEKSTWSAMQLRRF
jgi:elongation factor G